MPSSRALIIVDVQNDFLPGGPLGVAGGFDIIAPINRLMDGFDIIVATQDWHPADHGSFAANHPGKRPGDVIDMDGLPQILWPVHCVQNTPGALFAPRLDVARFTRIFRKGTDPRIDSYSGLFDKRPPQVDGTGRISQIIRRRRCPRLRHRNRLLREVHRAGCGGWRVQGDADRGRLPRCESENG